MASCLVYTSAFHPRWRADAARGGPMGEITAVDSLVDGLRALGARTIVARSLREFAPIALAWRAAGGPSHYFLDPVTLDLATRYRLLPARHAARVRILEWYGTPPSRVSRTPPGLRPDQYLLPYPDSRGWNTFLGYVFTSADGAPIADERSLETYISGALDGKTTDGVVWAKEARYLAGDAEAAVRAVSAGAHLHFTLAPERCGGMAFPANSTNHGLLTRRDWRTLLRRSSFVLGLGDPVAGPAALDALLEGCAYLDPVYPAARTVNGIPELTIRSQHPFAATIGAPFVVPLDLRDPSAVCATARLASDRRAARVAALPDLVRRLSPFTRDSHLARLGRILDS